MVVFLRAGVFPDSNYCWLSLRTLRGCVSVPVLCWFSAGCSAELVHQAGNEGAGQRAALVQTSRLCDSASGMSCFHLSLGVSEGPDCDGAGPQCGAPSPLPVPIGASICPRSWGWRPQMGGCSGKLWRKVAWHPALVLAASGLTSLLQPSGVSWRRSGRRARGCEAHCCRPSPFTDSRSTSSCVGFSRAEHKKHSPGCAFLSLKKACEELTLGEFLKLDKERAKNKIVRMICSKSPEPTPRGVFNPDLPSPSHTPPFLTMPSWGACRPRGAWLCPQEVSAVGVPSAGGTVQRGGCVMCWVGGGQRDWGHLVECVLGQRRWSHWNVRGLLQVDGEPA